MTDESSSTSSTTVTPSDKLRNLWKILDQGEDTDPDELDYTAPLYRYLTPLSARVTPTTPNKCTSTWLLRVPRALCNRGGNLHGGAAATIFDVCTSLVIAPLSHSRWIGVGVSRTLNCTYLLPIPEGSWVVVVAEVVGMGGRMAQTRGWIRALKPDKIAQLEANGGGGRNFAGFDGDKEGPWDEDDLTEGPILATASHGKVNTDNHQAKTETKKTQTAKSTASSRRDLKL